MSSEAESNIIMKEFSGCQIKFLKQKDKIWLTSSAIARGLDIHRNNINQIFHNNRELLGPYTCEMKIISQDNRPRDVRVFDKTGFIGICMRSNSPRALPFQQWVLKIVQEIEEKGFYIEKQQNLDPLEVILQQMDALKIVVVNQLEQKKKLDLIESKVERADNQIEDLKKKYEERPITPETKKVISDLVRDCVVSSREHWGYFYKLIWDNFAIRSITGISEKKGQEIITWIKHNPKFITYLDEEWEEDF